MSEVATTYQVRIHYREPTYENYAGRPASPYRWTYEVAAGSATEAKSLALREFRAIARASSVGWTRQVIAIELES